MRPAWELSGSLNRASSPANCSISKPFLFPGICPFAVSGQEEGGPVAPAQALPEPDPQGRSLQVLPPTRHPDVNITRASAFPLYNKGHLPPAPSDSPHFCRRARRRSLHPCTCLQPIPDHSFSNRIEAFAPALPLSPQLSPGSPFRVHSQPTFTTNVGLVELAPQNPPSPYRHQPVPQPLVCVVGICRCSIPRLLPTCLFCCYNKSARVGAL